MIGEMSGENVNFGPLCESGFLQGARKWMKTSEAVMFVSALTIFLYLIETGEA